MDTDDWRREARLLDEIESRPPSYRQAIWTRSALQSFAGYGADIREEPAETVLFLLRSAITCTASRGDHDEEVAPIAKELVGPIGEVINGPESRNADRQRVAAGLNYSLHATHETDLRSYPPDPHRPERSLIRSIAGNTYFVGLSFREVAAIEESGDKRAAFGIPLFAGIEELPPHVMREEDLNSLVQGLSSAALGTDFWKRWYESFLAGRPLNWDLQREVAVIPDAHWEKGPEHIARLIEEIEARFDLRAKLREAEVEIVRDHAQRLGIGGNNPPESIDELPDIPPSLSVVWEPFAELKKEVEAETPNVGRIKVAVGKLAALLAACGLWTARKVDAAATAAFVAAGTVSGTAFAAWMAGHGDAVAKVIEAAEAWIATLR